MALSLPNTAADTLAARTVHCSLRGRITRCGAPASGHRVIGRHRLQIGFPDDGKPCAIGFPTVRQVGEATTDADGDFAMAFDALAELEGTCSFSSLVSVEVFDGAARVWTSGTRTVAPLVRFDRELIPGCTAGSTVVRVVDELGRTVAGADVFVDGRRRGETDPTGHVFLRPALRVGDRLAARQLVHENRTSRDDHDADSNRNWNYRVYLTSVQVRHDSQGNQVRLPQLVVGDPGDTQVLRLRRQDVVVGLNLRASIEWDAGSTEFRRYEDRLTDMSELLHNATDGQFVVERLAIIDDGRHWDEADVRIYANLNQPSVASKDGIFGAGGRIRMNPNDAHYPGTLLHEIGHYAFGLGDEYEATDEWDPDNGPTRCTLRSTDDAGPFSDGAGKDSCLMRGARFNDRKKFCSGHPLNPHVGGTDQGPQDCWTDIIERYGRPALWRLKTPVSRGAIPERLPDSGEPLRGTTDPPSDITRTRGFIPLADWKTVVSVGRVTKAGLCEQLVVRAQRNGQPVVGARVTLHTAGGRAVYQGATKTAYRLAYGVQTGRGEIPVRGAHVGDEIDVLLVAGPDSARGRVRVPGCDGTLVVALAPFDPIPQPQAIAMNGAAPLAVTSRSAWPEDRTTVESADGRLRLVLPPGGLAEPDVVLVEELPEAPEGDMLAGPYALRTASGAELRAPARLHFEVPSAELQEDGELLVVRVEADGRTYELPSAVAAEASAVSAPVDRLGMYALVARPGG